jgi:hypothetical protein
MSVLRLCRTAAGCNLCRFVALAIARWRHTFYCSKKFSDGIGGTYGTHVGIQNLTQCVNQTTRRKEQLGDANCRYSDDIKISVRESDLKWKEL